MWPKVMTLIKFIEIYNFILIPVEESVDIIYYYLFQDLNS